MASLLVLAVAGGSVYHHVDVTVKLLICPQDTAAAFPQNEWSKREQGRSYNVFYDLALEVILHHC